MEKRPMSGSGRPWWMTPFGREPMGDVWYDRLWPEWQRMKGEEYTPNFDLYEKEGKYHLVAELPGVKKDDITINIENDLLTVKSVKESGKEIREADYYLRESSYGSFSRSFRLPSQVEEDKVDARFKDGLLELIMPAKESAKARKVVIKE